MDSSLLEWEEVIKNYWKYVGIFKILLKNREFFFLKDLACLEALSGSVGSSL